MPKRKLTYKDFLNYFGNNLQNKDKHDFEKEMMRDAFEEEAFDGLSKLGKDELEHDVAELKSNITEKANNKRKIIPVWFRYAASVIVLIGIGITIVYLNSNYWQDSMLKEQVSQEMEKADSMVVEAEKQLQELEQKKDTIIKEPEQLIAESRELEEEKEEKFDDKKLMVAEDAVEIEDELIIKEEAEADMDDMMEIIEFEEEQEVFEDEVFMKAEPQAAVETAAEEPAKIEEVIITESKTEKSVGRAKKSSNIRIRGVASQSKDKSPLYIIDGTPVDLSNTITIEGNVLGADDNMAIPGVSVVLEDMEVFGTTTDYNGYFSLTIPNDEELKTLIASFVGMETQKIELENDSNLLVYLEPSVMEMDKVIVTAYGVSEEENEVPTKVSAQPPGSISRNKYKKQILEQLDYSMFSKFPGKHKVKVSFMVGEDGSLSNFNCRNIPDIVFCNEIRRVIKELGNWGPATEDNINIGSIVKLTLKIEITE